MRNMQLIEEIESLKHSQINNIINERIEEFKNINKNSNNSLFKELCFCILTANFNAEKSIKIQDEISNSFISDSVEDLSSKLKRYGHRFPNTRAKYIDDSRKHMDKLKLIVNNNSKKTKREWLVNNVKGLGYKEASHFLRNIGFDDYAIIDFHIIDILIDNKLIEKPKCITKNKYLEIENILKKLAEKTNLTLSELDLYLWYMETGKILK